MNLFSFAKNDLDEVVFEHRNKQYGAYALRKSYDAHLLKATLSSFGLFLLLGAVFYLLTLFRPAIEVAETLKVISFDNTLSRKIEIVPDELPEKISAGKNVDNMHYRIVKDPLATQPLITPPDPSSIHQSNGTSTATSGTGDVSGVGLQSNTVAQPIVEEKTPYATFATEMPSFEGGNEALITYIRKQLVYPTEAMEFGKEGKVLISFVVQTDGTLSNIEIIRGFGFGSEDAAKKLIEGMPKWKPGKQNGKLLPVKFILPLQFQLQ